MLDRGRFALNRIACPSLPFAEFLDFAKSAGIGKVELRNDIRDGSVLDGMKPAEAAALLEARGVRATTINALQKFNLAAVRPKAEAELAELLATCKGIACPALVLCPNNDPGDGRSAELRLAETAESLRRFGPAFDASGVTGLIEPLGFGISSLASLDVALEAIRLSGFGCYRILVDSFHFHIGPDGDAALKKAAASGLVGMVHVSGVEDGIPTSQFRDSHRIMPGPRDVMKSRATIGILLDSGYAGDISFEPFSAKVQAMTTDALRKEIERSVEWLSGRA